MNTALVQRYTEQNKMNELCYLLTQIRIIFFNVTVAVMLVLMPLYIALGVYFKIYESSYAWLVSGGFLSGLACSVILLIFWTLFLVWFDWKCGVIFSKSKQESNGDQSPFSGNQKSSNFSQKSSNFSQKSPYFSPKSPNLSQKSNFSHKSNSSTKTQSQVPLTNSGLALKAFIYFIACSFNIVVVVGANLAFVFLTNKYSSTISSLAQIGLAMCKLSWSLVGLPFILNCAKFLLHKLSIIIDAKSNESKYIEIVLNIFNNIVVPCIATSVLEVNCFYNVLVAAPAVEVTAVASLCDGYLDISGQQKVCASYSDVAYNLVYDPAFQYSYQCSSTLLTSYTPVYVSMYVIDTFITPLVIYALKLLFKRINKQHQKAQEQTNNNSINTNTINSKTEVVIVSDSGVASSPPSSPRKSVRNLQLNHQELQVVQDLQLVAVLLPDQVLHPE